MSEKRDRYLQLKHEFLNSCGQCIGFRARGIDLGSQGEKTTCSPGADCHKTCAALGMGGAGKGKPAEAGTVAKAMVESAETADNIPENLDNLQRHGKNYLVQTCFRCGNSEEKNSLLPCRHKGESLWVCTRCLPALIHG
jgi:hypothetical protein